MDIQILELLEGAKRARGLAVVIDVFRAFSLEACLFERGAAGIYAVGAESAARALKNRHPDWVLIGERGGRILPGFDYGNSPSQTERAPLAGKTIVHTTSAGTQGLAAAAEGADEIITGSLRNAAAIARYIVARHPAQVSLVAMGWSGTVPAPEDNLCARYISSLLYGTPFDMKTELAKLRHTSEGSKFFNPNTQDVFPQRDYTLCTQADCCHFVIRARPLGGSVFEMSPLEPNEECTCAFSDRA